MTNHKFKIDKKNVTRIILKEPSYIRHLPYELPNMATRTDVIGEKGTTRIRDVNAGKSKDVHFSHFYFSTRKSEMLKVIDKSFLRLFIRMSLPNVWIRDLLRRLDKSKY